MKSPRRRISLSLSRTCRGIRDAVLEVWRHLALFAFVRGLRIPGLEAARARLSEEQQGALLRQRLVREIKGSRHLVQKGPLWVRRSGESILKFTQRNRVFLTSLGKVLVGLTLIILPVGAFVLIRGVLPVPGRIRFEEPLNRLPKQTNLRAEWPYTSSNMPKAEFEMSDAIPDGVFRGGEIFAIKDPGAPPGLKKISIGDSPARTDSFRGFLVSEHHPKVVNRGSYLPVDIAGRNRVLIWHYLFPTSKGQERCRLEIRNERDELLLSTESGAHRMMSAERNAWGTQLRERLTPGSVSDSGRLREFVLDSDVPPAEFRLSVQHLNVESGRAVSSAPLMEGACIYAVGQFLVESERVVPRKRRGALLVVVDSLRRELAYRADLMPELNRFWQKGGLRFERHFSPGAVGETAAPPLLASRYFREVAAPGQGGNEDLLPQLGRLPTIPSQVQDLGYRTAAIGLLSEQDTSPWQESVSIENRHYETRSITEEAGRWLERSGTAPFFLYLHYGTFRPPFRPPFSDIDVSLVWTSLLGLGIEEELERGLARAWDREFGLLLRKLEALGLGNSVDIFVTSNHGVQMSEVNYGAIPGLPIGLTGAARSRGPLTDGEVRVPLFIRPAEDLRVSAHRVERLTTHLDIAPTLISLLGGTPPASWRGTRLPPVGDERAIPLSGSVLTESNRMIGIIDVESSGRQRKMILRQRPVEAVVFRRELPWRTKISWNEHELFSQVDREGVERLEARIEPTERTRLLRLMEAQSLGPSVVRLEPRFTGQWNLEFLLPWSASRPEPLFDSAELSRFPEGTIAQWQRSSDQWLVRIQGMARPGEASWIVLPTLQGAQVRASSAFSFVGCIQGLHFSASQLSRMLPRLRCLLDPATPAMREEASPHFLIQVTAGDYESVEGKSTAR